MPRSPASARACPRRPDYAAALPGDRPGGDQARPGAGDPARPGRRARRRANLLAAPGQPAAGPVRGDPAGDRAGARARRSTSSFAEIRSGAGRRRLDRPGPPRGHHRRPRGRGQGAAPGHRGGVRQGDRDLRMGGGACRGDGRRGASGCARGWSSPISSNGPRASSTCSARPPRPPSCARIWSPSPASTCPRSTGGAPRGGC